MVEPRTRARRGWIAAALVALGGLVAAGCHGDEPKPSAEPLEDAGPKKNVDRRLAAAVAAAESAAPAAPAASGGDGPPEMGVFPPGKADALQPVGAPPKVEVLSEGAEPRVQLAYAPLTEEQKATFTIGVRVGPQSGLPTVDFELIARTGGDKKDKGDKKDDKKADKKAEKKGDKKDDKAKSGEPPPTPEGFIPVIVVINSATTAKEQLGQLPKEIAEKITKLKGSQLRYAISPDGTMTELGVALPRDAEPALLDVLRALGEAVSIYTVPLPHKPVGVGALWMATDRSASFALGLGVVRYRAIKLEKLDGQKPTLAIDIREYAARADVNEGGQSLFIGRFDSQGKASETLSGVLGQGTQAQLDVKAILGPKQGQAGQQLFVTLTAKGR